MNKWKGSGPKQMDHNLDNASFILQRKLIILNFTVSFCSLQYYFYNINSYCSAKGFQLKIFSGMIGADVFIFLSACSSRICLDVVSLSHHLSRVLKKKLHQGIWYIMPSHIKEQAGLVKLVFKYFSFDCKKCLSGSKLERDQHCIYGNIQVACSTAQQFSVSEPLKENNGNEWNESSSSHRADLSCNSRSDSLNRHKPRQNMNKSCFLYCIYCYYYITVWHSIFSIFRF